LPIVQTKEEEMSEKAASQQERATRGKKLLIFGMFALVVVTFVAVFLTVYLITAPVTGGAGAALQSALIVTAIAIVACVIVWFIYTKLILKQ
jgi:uncharacterized membrane protein YdbT with pleckstrin-like domain